VYLSRKKRKVLVSTAVIAVFAIFSLFINIQSAEASVTWDRYERLPGINEDIYEAEKDIMAKYNSSYTLVPQNGDIPHGPGNAYTNLTIDSDQKLMSKWYVSGYGPYLNYANNSSDPEGVSIDFNDDNYLYGKYKFVYVASEEEDLADAKSVAALRYTDRDLVPLLITSSYSSLSSRVVSTLYRNYVKNVVVVGGEKRMDNLMGIGDSFNIIRVGGQDRNKTYEYLQATEKIADEFYNISDRPELNKDGYLMKINDSSSFNPKIKSQIEDALKNYDFDRAVNIVLSTTHGTEDNIKPGGSPAVEIGCKVSADRDKAEFFRSYFLVEGDLDYGVYQYIGPDYIYDNESDDGGDSGDVHAVIDAPREVEAGEEIEISGRRSVSWVVKGETEDGDPIYESITDYLWSFSYQDRAMGDPRREGMDYEVWFTWPGSSYTQEVTLRVITESGKSGTDQEQIIVTAPIPKPVIEITGHLKENRKFTIDASKSYASKHYPIVRYDWEITGTDNSSIRYDGNLDNSITKDILIKTPGEYTITLTVENSVGITRSVSQKITIRPDEYPSATMKFIPMVIRDPNDDNYATFELRHTGGSPDEDIIDKRIWAVAYDSDNDGSFEDEIYKVYENGTWRDFGSLQDLATVDLDTINDGNKATVTFRSNQVGKYDFQLIVRERFGQPTIEHFVTKADRRVSRTF